MNATANGYQCTTCGQWIYSGAYHVCQQQFPVPQVGQVTIPPCRAPWNPLTPDAVRLIVREELERILQQLQQGKSGE